MQCGETFDRVTDRSCRIRTTPYYRLYSIHNPGVPTLAAECFEIPEPSGLFTLKFIDWLIFHLICLPNTANLWSVGFSQ